MIFSRKTFFLISFLLGGICASGQNSLIECKVEAGATVSNGDYAPYWLTANKYGMGSTEDNSAYLRAGIAWNKAFRHGWKLDAGLDLAGGKGLVSNFWVQQAYFDVSWKMLSLSIGSKERISSPLEKNADLTSGWMTEGMNTRPIPQIRAEIHDFYSLPFTGNWLALKGHVAYGAFLDGKWQEGFVQPGGYYTRDVKYHSKALMFRLGNKEKLPVEFEFGLHMATQFAGDKMRKLADGSSEVVIDMPGNFRNYINAFFPSSAGSDAPEGEQINVEGNMLGSWNFALNYYLNDWKFRVYLDHYFEDHSQMFWQYGRWKDGQIGVDITLPKNRWVSRVLWEGICTKDQSGALSHEIYEGALTDLAFYGTDNYFNHSIYNSWQYYGMGMGSPLLYGPAYNCNHSMSFRSNRMKAQHIGLQGEPTEEWSWRILASFARHWGTYGSPFDEVKRQFNGMAEVRFSPARLKNWGFKAAVGVDKGSVIGNSVGGRVSVNYKFTR